VEGLDLKAGFGVQAGASKANAWFAAQAASKVLMENGMGLRMVLATGEL
jgi:hypothetical protein